MGYLKSSFQLGTERIISPKYPKKETPKKGFDFIKVDDFDDRENKAIEIKGYSDKEHYAPETKLIDGTEDDEKEEVVNDIRIQQPETIHTNNIMEVYWGGTFYDYSGYSRMNRTMVFALSNRNVRVKIEIEPHFVHVNKSTQEQLRMLANNTVSPDAPKVFGVTVPLRVSTVGKNIVYTMIETSEKVHKNYAEKLNLVSEIWVATEYGKRILNASNVTTPIYVMPLGVDPLRYKPNCGTVDFGSATRKFKFLSVFRWSHRKGFDILLRAFMEEFSADEDVSLVLVSRNLDRPEEVGPQKIVDDFNDIKSFVRKSEGDLPHVALYTKPVHEKDMPKIYNSADAYCLLSRGEGFSLTVIEASSCGLPIIATNVTSHTDFLKQDNSFLVEPDGYIEAKTNGALPRMAKLCHFYEGQKFPDFSKTGVEQTRQHMRFVFENYRQAKEKAEKLRKLIVNNYTWDMAVDRVYNRLREIS